MSMAEPQEPKTERFAARLSVRQKRLLERAAELRGQSLTDFAIYCIQEIAERVIRDSEIMELTARDSRILVESLLNPPEPTERQITAARRYQQRMAH